MGPKVYFIVADLYLVFLGLPDPDLVKKTYPDPYILCKKMLS